MKKNELESNKYWDLSNVKTEIRAPTSKQLKALEGLCEYLMKKCRISKSSVTTPQNSS